MGQTILKAIKPLWMLGLLRSIPPTIALFNLVLLLNFERSRGQSHERRQKFVLHKVEALK